VLERQVSVCGPKRGVQIAKHNLCELRSVYMYQKFLRDYFLKLSEFGSCEVMLFSATARFLFSLK